MSSFDVKVQRIIVEPHPNADRLAIGRIVGQDYMFVVGKDQFHNGDLFVYIPEQAIVPDWIIEEMGLVGKLNGADHNRVKAQKFRGVLSQGLAYSPSCFWPNGWPYAIVGLWQDDHEYPEGVVKHVSPIIGTAWAVVPFVQGADIGEALGIVKYEPSVPKNMAGKWQPAPNHQAVPGGALWQGYTSLENIKKCPDAIQEGETVIITEKLHGTCLNVLWSRGEMYVSSLGVARRGFVLEEDADNLYWKVAADYHLDAFAALVAHSVGAEQIMLFGEIVGVQDLKYGLVNGQVALYLFDILVGGQYGEFWLDHNMFQNLCGKGGMPTVPELFTGVFTKDVLAELTSGNTTIKGASHIREGVVVRPIHERRSEHNERVVLKSISPDYLTRKGEATEYN